MITLNDKKVNHLRELIEIFYDTENDAEREECASTIIGILNYIFDTDTYELPALNEDSMR